MRDVFFQHSDIRRLGIAGRKDRGSIDSHSARMELLGVMSHEPLSPQRRRSVGAWIKNKLGIISDISEHSDYPYEQPERHPSNAPVRVVQTKSPAYPEHEPPAPADVVPIGYAHEIREGSNETVQIATDQSLDDEIDEIAASNDDSLA